MQIQITFLNRRGGQKSPCIHRTTSASAVMSSHEMVEKLTHIVYSEWQLERSPTYIFNFQYQTPHRETLRAAKRERVKNIHTLICACPQFIINF